MKLLKIVLLFSIFSVFYSCDPDPVVVAPKDFKLSGFAQKGPFASGAKVVVSELNSSLVETGRNFNGTITDDKGSFTVEGSDLTSNFVAVSADGFYFDEVNGQLSSSRLVLNALVDVSKGSTLNINILTHLEFDRVKQLIKSGQDFTKAKEQAKKEVLNIFKITDASSDFEKLDISKTEAEHAALLAISAILQGNHTVAQLSELLSKISLDIKEDGRLDAENLKAELLSQATVLNTSRIRTNLTTRFRELGVTTTLGNFEKYIDQFIKATAFVVSNQINYPKTSLNGNLNLLALSDTTLAAGSKYCFAGYLPDGASLKVVVKAPGQTILWVSSVLGSERGWNGGNPTGDGTRVWESSTNTPYCTVSILDIAFQIEVYENGSPTPKRIININSAGSAIISFDQTGKYGKNIFPPSGSSFMPGAYSFQVKINDTKEHTIKFEFYYFDKNSMIFSDAEGWTVVTDSSAPNNLKTTLTFKASKATADMKITLAGSNQATAQVWVDGELKNEWYKKMNW